MSPASYLYFDGAWSERGIREILCKILDSRRRALVQSKGDKLTGAVLRGPARRNTLTGAGHTYSAPVSVLSSSAAETQMRTYLVKIRLNGSVSWVEVEACEGGHAKAIVKAQYGNSVDILEAKPK